MRSSYLLSCVVLIALLLLPCARASALREGHLLGFPAISADGQTVYFTCWGDVWSAPRDGSAPATRLTDNVAYDGRPIPSPDGKSLLFVSDRFGNYDLFAMPSAGGEAQRLTWDSTTDYPYDWSSDGSSVLEYAVRQDLWGNCLYEVPVNGGAPRRITGPDQQDEVFGSYLGGGGAVVFARGAGDWVRKHYRGSATYELWTFDPQGNTYKQLTKNDCNDLWPQSSPDGRTLYFVSDRDGTYNLWRMDPRSGECVQVTHFEGDGVRWPRLSADGDEIIFEVFGELYVLPLNRPRPEKVRITFADDPKHEMAVSADMGNNISEYALSLNGRYFAVIVMGDLYILKNPESYPPDKKPDQDLSRTVAVVQSPGREMQPAWSPDSLKLTYISDREGQFDVYVYDMVTKQETRVTESASDEWWPTFSPAAMHDADQQYLLYYSGNRRLALNDLKTNKEETLAEGQLRDGPWALGYEWSPDGKWVAFVEDTPDYAAEVYLINIEQRKRIDVSFTPDWDTGPLWSKDGKWLAFTHYGPEGGDAMLLELSPKVETYDTELLFPEDKPKEEKKEPTKEEKPGEAKPEKVAAKDEVKGGEGEKKAAAEEKKEGEEAKPEEKKEEEKPKLPEVKIDLKRIELRAEVASPMAGTAEAVLFDPQSKYLLFTTDHSGKPELWAVTLEKRELSRLQEVEGQVSPQLAPDSSRLYFLSNGALGYATLTGTQVTGGGGVGVTSAVQSDTYRNWEQMLHEGWRHLRDGFYDQNMQGVDWNDVLARYLPRVREAATPEDFAGLMREMLGELGASHLGFSSKQNSREAPADTTADLGVYYDESFGGPGWKVAKVITDGPADQPASRMYAGDVILKLNGADIDAAVERGEVLRNLAGQVVTLGVRYDGPRPAVPDGGAGAAAQTPDKTPAAGDSAGGTADAAAQAPAGAAPATGTDQAPPAGERTVTIKPAPADAMRQLRYEQWVEDNRAFVYERGHERIGYQHIQQMNGESLDKFRRELFSESRGKEALIVDVRFNGGGHIHEDLMDLLDRRPFGYSALRGAPRTLQPELLWKGPIVVLINPSSYSDAEIFPHVMQELGLGVLLGEPTGGNVIGTFDFQLLDGSGFRLPGAGWWLLSGKDMEGNGAVPDVLVPLDPAAARSGRDNQLEEAVKLLMGKLGG